MFRIIFGHLIKCWFLHNNNVIDFRNPSTRTFSSPMQTPLEGLAFTFFRQNIPSCLLPGLMLREPFTSSVRAPTPSSSPMSASAFRWISSFSQPLSARSLSPSFHSRGHLIHDEDGGNVTAAHVKIKSPSTSHTQGYLPTVCQ